MAVYTNTQLKEQAIYGSSRLGLYVGDDAENKHQLGQRYYELSNHLGNVLTVITDNKLPEEGTVLDEVAEEYRAFVLSATDYYPFGLAMEERSFKSDAYRYGFNGHERSNEIMEEHYATEFRELNSRIVRWWSNDPLDYKYPDMTPYCVNGNNPIGIIDVKGDSIFIVAGNAELYYVYKASLKVPISSEIISKFQNNPTEHIFLTVDNFNNRTKGHGNGAGAVTYSDVTNTGGVVDIYGSYKILPTVGISVDEALQNFVGVDLSDYKGHKVHLISINSNYLNKSILLKRGNSYRGALEIWLHEPFAHIINESGSGQADHIAFGVTNSMFFAGDTPAPKTDAKTIYDELKNLAIPSKKGIIYKLDRLRKSMPSSNVFNVVIPPFEPTIAPNSVNDSQWSHILGFDDY